MLGMPASPDDPGWWEPRQRPSVRPVRTDDWVIAEFRRNAGHVGGELAQTPIVLVHHIGARSGIERVTPLAYQPLSGGLMIVGSNGGSPADPAWCHNLRAHPRIDVEVGTETFLACARELDDAARDAIWPALVEGAPVLGEYQAKATRRFPVFLLTRDSEAALT
jgi:deazaflavin-dependent oxidoreductase (nitroreductase family)